MADSTVAEFLATLPEPARARAERLAAAIERAGIPMTSTIRWRQLLYGVDGDLHHWICSISSTKRAAVLNLHFGGLLDDPDGRLMAGTSRFLRRLEFATADDVDDVLVASFVRAAVGRLPYFKANWKAIQAGTLSR